MLEYIGQVDDQLTKLVFIDRVSRINDEVFLDQILKKLSTDKTASKVLLSEAKRKYGVQKKSTILDWMLVFGNM